MAPSMPVRLVDKDGRPISADNPLAVDAEINAESIDIDLTGVSTEAEQEAQTAELTAIREAVQGTLDVDLQNGLPAGDNVIGRIGTPDIVVPVTPTLDTDAYSDGDLLFDSTQISNAVRVNNHTAVIQTITIIDKDNQKAPMTLLIANAATDFGSLNAAPNPSDAAAETVAGHLEIAADDYVDLGGASVACVRNVGMLVSASGETTSLWIAAITRGTPTHTASGLVIKVGLLRS